MAKVKSFDRDVKAKNIKYLLLLPYLYNALIFTNMYIILISERKEKTEINIYDRSAMNTYYLLTGVSLFSCLLILK